MKRILLFGNSGSGKSTLAKRLSREHQLAHLDLDTVAWQPSAPTERRSLEESWQDILSFVQGSPAWVIEGCYTDLLEKAAPLSNEMIFLNPPIAVCVANARSRPWEAHKYSSKAAQDNNLDMLIDWIKGYTTRTDHFSYASHLNLYNGYTGNKQMITENESHVR
ncbi:MAG: AAA family ATPase [Halioglobus sp.]